MPLHMIVLWSASVSRRQSQQSVIQKKVAWMGRIGWMNQAMSPAHMLIFEVSFGVGLLRYPRLGRWTSISMSLQECLTIRQEFIENKGETHEEIPFGDFKPRLVADQSEIKTRQPLRHF